MVGLKKKLEKNLTGAQANNTVYGSIVRFEWERMDSCQILKHFEDSCEVYTDKMLKVISRSRFPYEAMQLHSSESAHQPIKVKIFCSAWQQLSS